MQDNIEKLYELAGVWSVGCYDCPLFIDDIICLGIVEEKTCPYPPFTDTKQLELIKWFDYFSYFSTVGNFHMQFHLKDKQYHKIGFVSFEDTLAGLVCELWEDLTDEQREEVKGILQ